MKSRIVYYALGGGHGHAVRGLAILRSLRQLHPDADCLLMTTRRLEPWARLEDIPVACPAGNTPTRDELRRWAESHIGQAADTQLVVDVFPRGILGELAEQLPGLPRPAWLVSRRVRPEFYLADGVREALERSFAQLIWCEEADDELSQLRVEQRRVPPVLIRDAGECLGREAARRSLELRLEHPLVLALGWDDASRQRELLRLLRKVQARIGPERFTLLFVTQQLPPLESDELVVRQLYPVIHHLAAADMVVAAGGYSAVHEIQALGLPSIHMPQQRRYDDQHWRVRHLVTARDAEELEELLRHRLEQPLAPSPTAQADRDGARRIARLLGRT